MVGSIVDEKHDDEKRCGDSARDRQVPVITG